jgi:hypothetical protein
MVWKRPEDVRWERHLLSFKFVGKGFEDQ